MNYRITIMGQTFQDDSLAGVKALAQDYFNGLRPARAALRTGGLRVTANDSGMGAVYIVDHRPEIFYTGTITKSPVRDCSGRPIHIGDTVRQSRNGIRWFEPAEGALKINAGATGTVTAVGRTRVAVDFRRTKRTNYGSTATEEYVIDRVSGDSLTRI